MWVVCRVGGHSIEINFAVLQLSALAFRLVGEKARVLPSLKKPLPHQHGLVIY